MAKKKPFKEEQLDLFNDNPLYLKPKQEDKDVELKAAEVEPVDHIKEISSIIEKKQAENLKTSEVEMKAEKVELSEEEFIADIPYDSRFVTMNLSTGKITLTSLEDGLNLKNMKEMFPDAVTKLQKVDEIDIPDITDNISFLEGVKDLANKKLSIMLNDSKSKKKADLEAKEIESLDNGDYDPDPEEPVFNEEVEEKPKEVKRMKRGF